MLRSADGREMPFASYDHRTAAPAAFGLAPGLLLDRVSAWTNTNISELEDTLKGETAESPSRTE